MGRLRLALVCALGALVLVPHHAAAGGWWSHIHMDRSQFTPGDRVEIDEEVLFGSVVAAEAAQGSDRFRVYLLRGFDPSVVDRAMRKASPGDWWSLGGAEAIELGRVSVRVSDGNLARATAAFTVPELPPATYTLMLCDLGCTEPLADLVPTNDFTVVSEPRAAASADVDGSWSWWPVAAALAGALALLWVFRRVNHRAGATPSGA